MANGKMFVSGSYANGASGPAVQSSVQVNSDGSLDLGFNAVIDHSLQAATTQADGKIIIGGQFATVGQTARARLARLNVDGTLDTGFNPVIVAASAAMFQLYSIAIQTDGKIIIGGQFDSVNGQIRKKYGAAECQWILGHKLC